MSELKAFTFGLGQYCEDGTPCVVAFDADQNPRLLNEQIYIKSEADKVIEELKKERDWLAKDRAQAYDDLEKRAQLNIKQESEIEELKEQVHDYAQGLYVMQARAEMELRRSNRKRCLAMARWCELERTERFSVLYPKNFGYLLMKKWRKIWFALAEEPTWAKFMQIIHKETK